MRPKTHIIVDVVWPETRTAWSPWRLFTSELHEPTDHLLLTWMRICRYFSWQKTKRNAALMQSRT